MYPPPLQQFTDILIVEERILLEELFVFYVLMSCCSKLGLQETVVSSD